MKKFRIYYNNTFSNVNCFNRFEKFMNYEEAYEVCVSKNKFGVRYPELIQIFEL